LRNKTDKLQNYYQLHCTFETLDAMGANFINSCLEQFAQTFKQEALAYDEFSEEEKQLEVVMSILSNYVPNCLVRAEVSCPVADLQEDHSIDPQLFAEKIVRAVAIAKAEPHRAVTHNKGIMNGVDAVVLATGNDFSLHPLVKLALEILQQPSAKELMQLVAVAGLAQNFAAVKSLVTTGIQQGHMKMHLLNMLNQLQANPAEKKALIAHFKTNVVTHSSVTEALTQLRNS